MWYVSVSAFLSCRPIECNYTNEAIFIVLGKFHNYPARLTQIPLGNWFGDTGILGIKTYMN